MKRLFIILLSCVAFAGNISAQNTRDFDRARTLFQQKQYAAAAPLLRNYLSQRPSISTRQEAEYMLACSAYALQDQRRAETLKEFLNNYPKSAYSNRVKGLLGSTYFFEQRYEEAIAVFDGVDPDQLSKDERDDIVYRMGVSYMAVGERDKAAAWFEVLENYSKVYAKDARYYLSYIRYTQGRYDEALQGFLSLQGDERYGTLVQFYIAESYLQKGHYDKAEIVAQNFLSAQPNAENVAEFHRILGEVYYAYYRDYSRAVTWLESYLSASESPRRDALYMLGMSYYGVGAYLKAPATLTQVTTLNDAVTQNANLHIGLSYLQLADKEKAAAAFKQAAASDFDTKVKEQAAYNYAICVHETTFSGFNESVTAYEEFLNNFPHSEYAGKISGYLTDLYLNTNNYEASLASIGRIQQPDANIQDAKQKILFKLGTQELANADANKAIEYLNQSISLSQDAETRAEAYYWRAEAFYRNNKPENAQRDFNEYLRLTRQKDTEMYALAHYNLGYIAFHNKEYDTARNYFSRFTSLSKGTDSKAMADAYNRIGDSYFHVRAFDNARYMYSQAEELNTPVGDYAFYQLALISGIEKDYAGKITLLNRMTGRYPSSTYLPSAIYEKGRAYVQMENNLQAIAAFNELVSKYPDNALSPKAAAEIGLLYYQDQEYDKAITAYRMVIEKYPNTDESALALNDLKSLYIDRNRVDEFAELSKSLGGATIDTNEQDSLTYVAAEKVFMRGRIEEAKKSFASYLERYPEGAFRLNAYYYLTKIAQEQLQHSKVIEYSEEIIRHPESPYAGEVMQLRADVLFNRQQYGVALEAYKQMYEHANTPETRILASTGMLRSAYLSLQDNETIDAASLMLAELGLQAELMQEATYFRARAYLKLNEQTKAMSDLKVLAKNTLSSYGAEAKFMLAEQYYMAKDYANAEKELLDFIEKSTPHAYWLARGFILLADTYMATGKTVEAKQYLISLQQNYSANDDIQEMIKKRLAKMEGK